MGIYRRQNPSGEIIYGIDYYDGQGKRIKKIIGSKRMAEAALAKLKTKRFEEKIMGVKRQAKIYFLELAEKYEKYSKVTFNRDSHNTNMAGMNSFLPYLGNKYINEITINNIEEYKLARLHEVKPATLNRNLTTLKRMLNLACEWGFSGETISKKIKKVKEPPGRLRFLSKDEIKRLLKCCSRHKYLELAVLLDLNTGMRKGEILSLTWNQIDLTHGFIHLDRTKSNRRRDIPINRILKKQFIEWKEHSQGDKVFEYQDIKRSFSSAVKRAGIKDFHFHDLRHTFASHLIMEGVDLTTVSRLMGHSTIEMTMRYAHLSPDHRMRAVERIGSIISE